MNPLRRPELWLLLVLVAAGLVWVAVTQSGSRSPESFSRSADGSGMVDDLQVTRTQWTPDGTHRRLRVEFTAENRTTEALDVAPPSVRLLDAAGAEVPLFFVPGAFPPALAPGTRSASWIEFWLTEHQARDSMTLVVEGRRVLIAPATRG
ncbi:MAG: hypothetical protein ACKV19_16705 [Verrucomicrobiales bacterium]